MTDDLIVCEPEQLGNVLVRVADCARVVDDQHGIRRRLQRSADQQH
jgi:hypothetical protein